MNSNHAKKYVEKYKIGSKHPLFYDINFNSISVLEPGFNWKTLLLLIIPIITMIWGVSLVYYLLKKSSKS